MYTGGIFTVTQKGFRTLRRIYLYELISTNSSSHTAVSFLARLRGRFGGTSHRDRSLPWFNPQGLGGGRLFTQEGRSYKCEVMGIDSYEIRVHISTSIFYGVVHAIMVLLDSYFWWSILQKLIAGF